MSPEVPIIWPLYAGLSTSQWGVSACSFRSNCKLRGVRTHSHVSEGGGWNRRGHPQNLRSNPLAKKLENSSSRAPKGWWEESWQAEITATSESRLHPFFWLISSISAASTMSAGRILKSNLSSSTWILRCSSKAAKLQEMRSVRIFWSRGIHWRSSSNCKDWSCQFHKKQRKGGTQVSIQHIGSHQAVSVVGRQNPQSFHSINSFWECQNHRGDGQKLQGGDGLEQRSKERRAYFPGIMKTIWSIQVVFHPKIQPPMATVDWSAFASIGKISPPTFRVPLGTCAGSFFTASKKNLRVSAMLRGTLTAAPGDILAAHEYAKDNRACLTGPAKNPDLNSQPVTESRLPKSRKIWLCNPIVPTHPSQRPSVSRLDISSRIVVPSRCEWRPGPSKDWSDSSDPQQEPDHHLAAVCQPNVTTRKLPTQRQT